MGEAHWGIRSGKGKRKIVEGMGRRERYGGAIKRRGSRGREAGRMEGDDSKGKG